jgi:hypothetical protein
MQDFLCSPSILLSTLKSFLQFSSEPRKIDEIFDFQKVLGLSTKKLSFTGFNINYPNVEIPQMALDLDF